MRALLSISVLCAFLSQVTVAGEFIPPGIEIPLPENPQLLSSEEAYVAFIGDMKFYVSGPEVKSVVTNRWPNGVLVIEFDSSLSATRRQDFLAACSDWADAGVSCAERNGEEAYFVVLEHSGEGCRKLGAVSCAPLGYQTVQPGQQKPSIEIHVDSWDNSRTVQHEIGHAFGLIHEHSRKDRDSFVTYQPSNVKPGLGSQFRKIDTEINSDYDYLSVMHYRNCDFSIHDGCTSAEEDIPLQTLYVTACGLSNVVGGNQITDLDIDSLRAAYNPQLAAAFGARRSVNCGVTEYSQSQIDAMCADGSCAGGTVDPVQWTKYNEITGNDCGFAPIRNYPGMCTAKSQEHIRHWFDKDPCSCNICSTRFEWWVACGCSVQQTQNKCTDFNTPLTAQKALDLANSGDLKFMAVGSLVSKLWVLVGQGNAELGTIESVGPLIVKNLSDAEFEEKFKKLSTAIRILSAARLQQISASSQGWKLTKSTFDEFARRVGFE